MIPLSAAAAVAIIGATTAAVLPNMLAGLRSQAKGHNHHSVQLTGNPATHFLAATSEDGATISIHSALNGATVATIAPPVPGATFNTLATGNGVTYVVAVWHAGVCGTSLYSFRLTSSGQATALTRFRPGSIDQMISQLAVSQDGRTLAFWGQKCLQGAGNVPADLSVINLATQRVRQWTVPGQADINPLSLSAHGRLLEYSVGLTKLFPSAVYLLPTNAAPGAAADHSRVLVRASQYGASADVNSAVMTPDASKVYFTTMATGREMYTGSWVLREVSVATGRASFIGDGVGVPDPLVANPSVTRAIMIEETLAPAQGPPYPDQSPSASPSPYSSATPSTYPSASPSPYPSATPSTYPSASPSPYPSATPSTYPSAYVYATLSTYMSATPYPSATPSASVSPYPTTGRLIVRGLVLRVDLINKTIDVLNQPTWQPQISTYFW